ncbi:MAG TPA: hypothetical protein VNV25_25315 [Gemmatimonadaceae bacterium]|jgi:hypothetical protein|nr:hypothetical protein [Gemmatimonadaceae bacterium]
MRRLTDQERIALREAGPPGEGPVSDATFAECVRMGWGFWLEGSWYVTGPGIEALRLDDLASQS